jgi:hypothetical protein
MLADLVYKALHENLSREFRVVDRPGPRTLRLRLALTQAKHGVEAATNYWAERISVLLVEQGCSARTAESGVLAAVRPHAESGEAVREEEP